MRGGHLKDFLLKKRKNNIFFIFVKKIITIIRYNDTVFY